MGLLVSEKARKYAIATSLPEPVDPQRGPLVLQYDLRLQNGLDCGGAYLKFLMPQVLLTSLPVIFDAHQ
jgi:calnexin